MPRTTSTHAGSSWFNCSMISLNVATCEDEGEVSSDSGAPRGDTVEGHGEAHGESCSEDRGEDWELPADVEATSSLVSTF